MLEQNTVQTLGVLEFLFCVCVCFFFILILPFSRTHNLDFHIGFPFQINSSFNFLFKESWGEKKYYDFTEKKQQISILD